MFEPSAVLVKVRSSFQDLYAGIFVQFAWRDCPAGRIASRVHPVVLLARSKAFSLVYVNSPSWSNTSVSPSDLNCSCLGVRKNPQLA